MKKTEAIKLFGGLSELAEALGITTQAISQWGDDVPQLRVYQINEIIALRKAKASNGGDDAA